MKDEKAWKWLNENELSYTIWDKKYRYNDESFDEWLNRVSNGDDDIRKLIFEKKFLFGGRILANRGLEKIGRKISLSNCYVITPPDDSIESIFETATKLARTYSYGGGCIEENTKIIVKNKGRIPIKDVKIGDYVLSFNVSTHKDEWKKVLDWHYTNVKLEDQIEYVYSNGIRLKTSKKHPILTLTPDGYCFKKYDELKAESHTNKSLNQKEMSYIPNQEIDDISWFIGCHMGDGTADYRRCPRIRINGDNYQVIHNYANVLSKLNNSIIKPHRDNSAHYKSIMWGATSSSQNNVVIFNKYFDNQINKKTYTWKVPEYIKNNDAYVPFLAGLLDSDGYITDEGNIDIAICSKNAIEEIASYLSEHGQTYHVSIKHSKRNNESTLYRLYIYTSSSIYNLIYQYVQHDQKKAAMSQHLSDVTNKIRDLISITQEELDVINNFNYKSKYAQDQRLYYNLKAHQYDINKRKKIGSKTLYYLYHNGVFTAEQYNEMLSRTSCKQIILDNDTKYNYIDITVEGNKNYYAGNFGFVNIHNCGIDVSKLRPKNAKVNNAATTTSGATSFMDFFSYVTGLIGQSGRRGALMISIDCTHPDLEEFINLKSNLDVCTKANISVRVSDQFMQAVKNNNDWELSFTTEHETIKKTVKAKEIFNLLAKRNWEMAEPGILFWDNIKNHNMLNNNPEFSYAGVNPCEPHQCTAWE